MKLYSFNEYIFFHHFIQKHIDLNALGRTVEWLNTAKQIPYIIRRLGEVHKKLVKSIAGRKRRDLESKMTAALSDGIGDMVT
jgi:hypothetical protein